MANIRVSRRGGRVFRGGRMVRESSWVSIPAVATTLTGGGAGLIRSSSAGVDLLRPFTIVRTRIHLGLQSDQLVATEDQVCGYGACVVTDQASAIGVTAIPTPITDQDSDVWFLWQAITASYEFQSAVGTNPNFQTQMTVDSRAMRKVDDGEDVIFVAEAAGISDGFTLIDFGRMLIKLH